MTYMTLLQPWITNWLVIMHMRQMERVDDTRGVIGGLVAVVEVMTYRS